MMPVNVHLCNVSPGCCSLWIQNSGSVIRYFFGDTKRDVGNLGKVIIVCQLFSRLTPKTLRVVRHVLDEADDLLDRVRPSRHDWCCGVQVHRHRLVHELEEYCVECVL